MLQVKQYLAHTKTNLSLYIDKQTPCGVTNPAESEKIMKKRTNETIGKYYSVIVDSVIFTAKLTPCEMCKEYNAIVIKNSIGYTVYTSIKRDYLSIYEIISAWAVKSFNAVKGLTIIEA